MLDASPRPCMRTHYVQPDVGHHPVFSGKRWQNHIDPLVRDVIHSRSEGVVLARSPTQSPQRNGVTRSFRRV